MSSIKGLPEGEEALRPISPFKITGNLLAGRRLALIDPNNPKPELEISVACRTNQFGLEGLRQCLFENPNKPRYVPVTMGQKVVYVNVNSVAKRLLITEDEVRTLSRGEALVDKLQERAGVVQRYVRDIQQDQASLRAMGFQEVAEQGEKQIYEAIVKGAAQALDESKERNSSCQVSLTSESPSVLYISGGIGEGARGAVFKVLEVISKEHSVLKKSFANTPENQVATLIMEHQEALKGKGKESHLVAVKNVTTKKGKVLEEYEFAKERDMGKSLAKYGQQQLISLCKRMVLAGKELQEIGYAYLDLKPSNIMNLGTLEVPQWKLGDFDPDTPFIKDLEGFKNWAKKKTQAPMTPSYNTYRECQAFAALQTMVKGLSVQGGSGIQAVKELLSEEQQRLLDTALDRTTNLEDAYQIIYELYKDLSEKAYVFQLGLTLLEGAIGSYDRPLDGGSSRRKYVSESDSKKNCEVLNQSNKIEDGEFKQLIVEMLDFNPSKRPSLADIERRMERL